ncbi:MULTISPECIES: threonine/serine exporter family protein [Paenibacillus]|uniref:Membrane protein n=1 Tax=Paenibacillus albilobatus TaxID=2716884 RepID=A0A919XEZ0_9BACL|nr:MULTISPECIES: threonine/serine exporter family protein [Paenibacillus]MDR9854783.1 threonine/serine exporter family protein [Paenibacillus sp. VCA1]GIO29745.1 membrane protein [Paenibacillus albilobatus]
MYYIEQIVTSFIASAAFGMIFNAPKKTLWQCGLAGMVGWVLYIWLQDIGVQKLAATVVAAYCVTMISYFFAKMYRKPIIVFSVSGIIPLVPGGLAYDAMRNAVENHYDQAVQSGAVAFMMSGAIALGLLLSEVTNQLIRKIRAAKTP